MQHHYRTTIKWTGNKGTGTDNYRNYERNYEVTVTDKPKIFGSSDPAFRGDKTKYNPEDLLVTSLSSCHMLWYLHLCSEAGVIVIDYIDKATGIMVETSNGGGQFVEVTLNPKLKFIENRLLNTNGLRIGHIQEEAECKEYDGYNFDVGAFKIKYRKAKITPKKIGQFVTLWKRNSQNQTEPFDIRDSFDFYVITTQQNDRFGLFLFPKHVLVENHILTFH